MKLLKTSLCIVFLFTFFLSSCGVDLEGNYSGLVEGKRVRIHFQKDGQAQLFGYFPDELSGQWVEEKTFKEPQIWATFNGPKEKPFRVRFELIQEGENLVLVGLKARPMGKGMKLNTVRFQGKPIFKPGA